MKVFFAAIFILGTSVASRLISSDDLQKLFLRVGRNEATEQDSKTLQDVLRIYRAASTTTEQFSRIANRRESITCLICRSGMAAVFDMIRQGATDEDMMKAVEPICSALGILRPASCRGILELNVPIFTYIINNTPEATPRTFCGLVLQNAEDPNYCVIEDPRFDWTVELPELPEATTLKVSNKEESPLTIALITDAHIDPLYEANGVADCNEPTCCRKGQLPQTDVEENDVEEFIAEDDLIEGYLDSIDLDVVNNIKSGKITRQTLRDTSPAGFWGDYRHCDSPIWAYDDAIERISSTHPNIDVVYYVGDSIDHHVWETTYDLIDEVNAYIIDKMRKQFGDNVLIVPSIGNHESQPTNQFAPISVKGAKLNTTWLYDSLARKWDFYLTEEAKASLRRLGAFSIRVRPGLRAISINTNIAYRYNWWVVYDPSDAKQHLEWLVDELYKAELAGDRVHILAHMPPGVRDLTYSWTREYNRIVNRFSATIAGEFNGHTHSDEFKIFYSPDGTPVNMAWGVGSATAFSNYNLNYKIATVNQDTFEPLNIENYIYNLTEANLTPNQRPRWFQLYDMKNTFNLQDLSPKSMAALVRNMVTDKLYLLEKYAAFFSKVSDTRWPECDEDCKFDTLCNTVVTVLWERERCNELRKLFLS